LHAYYVRGEGSINAHFGIASVCILVIATGIMAYNVFTNVLLKSQEKLRVKKIAKYSFVTLLFVACTSPDVIMFFPWKEDAYDEKEIDSEFPNDECVRVTLMKLCEDVPQFILQLTYLAAGNYDLFTALNLLFTVVMLFYFVTSKSLVLLMDPSKLGAKTTGLPNTAHKGKWSAVAPEPPKFGPEHLSSFNFSAKRPLPVIMKDLNLVLEKYWGTKLGGDKAANTRILDALQEELCVENWEGLAHMERICSVAQELGVQTHKNGAPVEQGLSSYRPYHLIKHDLIKRARKSQFIAVDLTVNENRKWRDVLEDLREYCKIEDWDQLDSKKRTYYVAHELCSVKLLRVTKWAKWV